MSVLQPDNTASDENSRQERGVNWIVLASHLKKKVLLS